MYMPSLYDVGSRCACERLMPLRLMYLGCILLVIVKIFLLRLRCIYDFSMSVLIVKTYYSYNPTLYSDLHFFEHIFLSTNRYTAINLLLSHTINIYFLYKLCNTKVRRYERYFIEILYLFWCIYGLLSGLDLDSVYFELTVTWQVLYEYLSFCMVLVEISLLSVYNESIYGT